MALISALLLLLVVSLLAVGLSMDSSMDVRLAAYQKFRARAFGFAESGLMAGADILESNTADAGWDDDAPPFQFPHLSADYDGLLTIDPDAATSTGVTGTFYLEKNPNEDRTLEMTGDIESDVIIQKVVSQITKGAAMQVAAGYAGVGKGLGGGGANVIYNIESSGFDANNARSSVAMNYRMVTK
jgi:hypothetical protein